MTLTELARITPLCVRNQWSVKLSCPPEAVTYSDPPRSPRRLLLRWTGCIKFYCREKKEKKKNGAVTGATEHSSSGITCRGRVRRRFGRQISRPIESRHAARAPRGRWKMTPDFRRTAHACVTRVPRSLPNARAIGIPTINFRFYFIYIFFFFVCFYDDAFVSFSANTFSATTIYWSDPLMSLRRWWHRILLPP